MKNLKYKIGDIVFLKNDPNRKNAMLVSRIDTGSSLVDYELSWLNSQRKLETMQAREELLLSESQPQPEKV